MSHSSARCGRRHNAHSPIPEHTIPHCLGSLLLGSLFALAPATTSAGTLVQRVSVNDSAAGLSLAITPPPTAADEQLYLAARLEGPSSGQLQWYSFDGQHWQAWSGNNNDLPSVTVSSPSELILLQQLKLSAYSRIDFYAGIGSSVADMLQRVNYEVFYRYFGTPIAHTP